MPLRPPRHSLRSPVILLKIPQTLEDDFVEAGLHRGRDVVMTSIDRIIRCAGGAQSSEPCDPRTAGPPSARLIPTPSSRRFDDV